jgi:hypothetical protein
VVSAKAILEDKNRAAPAVINVLNIMNKLLKFFSDSLVHCH